MFGMSTAAASTISFEAFIAQEPFCVFALQEFHPIDTHSNAFKRLSRRLPVVNLKKDPPNGDSSKPGFLLNEGWNPKREGESERKKIE